MRCPTLNHYYDENDYEDEVVDDIGDIDGDTSAVRGHTDEDS